MCDYLDPWQTEVVFKVYKLAYPGLRDDEIYYKMYCDHLIPEDYFDLGD